MGEGLGLPLGQQGQAFLQEQAGAWATKGGNAGQQHPGAAFGVAGGEQCGQSRAI